MLFNSFEFIFLFLPLVILFSYLSYKYLGKTYYLATLVLFSLAFYSWWDPYYLLLLIASIVINFQIGKWISKSKKKILLILGVTFNLVLIAYFKYFGFLAINFSLLFNQPFSIENIILPLAISFFTFQQIAYLVDTYQDVKQYNFIEYALFVSFFPQLIAGPIVHHKDILPQFDKIQNTAFTSNNVIIGISIFTVGLFKKTVLADGVAPYANSAFNSVSEGKTLDLFEAWGGALAYTFQLYFDFSGYSDMAIGLARIFGIILPLNFYSPYKASDISEFWRRWHITLSTFLRDYLYIPLGGNRKGKIITYRNLIFTMLLGGVWHGAGWNYIIWGGLHGLYLASYQVWANATTSLVSIKKLTSWVFLSWLITMVAVVIGWVVFRTSTPGQATSFIASLFGFNGVALPGGIIASVSGISSYLDAIGITTRNGGGEILMYTWLWNIVLFFISIIAPNTQNLFRNESSILKSNSYPENKVFWPFQLQATKMVWQKNSICAVVLGIMFTFSILTLFQVSEFLYFQF